MTTTDRRLPTPREVIAAIDTLEPFAYLGTPEQCLRFLVTTAEVRAISIARACQFLLDSVEFLGFSDEAKEQTRQLSADLTRQTADAAERYRNSFRKAERLSQAEVDAAFARGKRLADFIRKILDRLDLTDEQKAKSRQVVIDAFHELNDA